MAEEVPAGTWVEIHQVLLDAGHRAPRVPAETQSVPLECRAKGVLIAAASLGDEVEIATSAGRRLRGTLTTVNPSYLHGFGPPVPELLGIGHELRDLLGRGESEE